MNHYLKDLSMKWHHTYLSLEDNYFNHKKFRVLLWFLFVGLILVSMFVLNSLTPYLADDYNNLTRRDLFTNEPLTTFSDYARSIYHYYFNWGGRIVSAVYINIFTLIPKAAFNVINTIAYLCVITLIYLNCKSSKVNMLSMFIGIHLLIWICTPDYGQVMLWISGAATYLYDTLPILGLILLFRKYSLQITEGSSSVNHYPSGKGSSKSSGIIKASIAMVLTFLLGIIAGLGTENAGAGLIVILTLYLMYYKSHHARIKGYLVTGYFGSLIGYGILIAAPGNYIRSNTEGVHLTLLFKIGMISYFAISFLVVIFILYFVVAKITLSTMKINKKNTLKESFIFVGGAFSSAFCMVAAPSSPERTWFIVIVYAIIAIGLFYGQWKINKADDGNETSYKGLLRRVIVGVLLIVGIYYSVMWTDTVIVSSEIMEQTKERNLTIMSEIDKGNKNIAVPIITHKYPFLSHHDALYGLTDISGDPQYWINISMAKYYGVDSITGY